MLNKSKVFKILNLKEKIKSSKVNNLEALSVLDNIINEYSKDSNINDDTLELQLYLNEVQKLKRISDKAEEIESEISKLKKDNLGLFNDVCLMK